MMIWMRDFKTKQKPSENWYDIFEDYPLIEASFLEQYGIRLRIENGMSWDEFCTYLAGLNENTTLGKIVRIRSEKDPKIIKEFSPSQKEIRNKWLKGKAVANISMEDYEKIMKGYAQAFASMAK